MSEYWLGILTLPVAAFAVLVVVLACWGIREVASKAFGALLRRYPPIKDGIDVGAKFPIRYATDFGVRSAFAAIALSARKMMLFEPIRGFAVFIMISRPKEHTDLTRRAKNAIERAYDELLDQDGNHDPT